MTTSTHTDEPPRKRAKPNRPSSLDEKIDDGADDSPACNSCRRRKTKCSRQSPCSHCTRLQVDCVYDDVKERPGIKPAAFQMLTQRISNLEQMLLGQGFLLEPLIQRAMGQSAHAHSSLDGQTEALKRKYLAAVRSPTPNESSPSELVENQLGRAVRGTFPISDVLSDFSHILQGLLPTDDQLHSMVNIYFAQLHPWIPILHEKSFRQKLVDGAHTSQLGPILLAITSVCLRLDQSITIPKQDKHAWSLKCRNTVILQGMDKFSVENLQALVIIAFDIVSIRWCSTPAY